MSRCFTWVSIWFRRTQYITSIGLFYKKCGEFTWRVSDCEELSGELLTGDDGVGFRMVIIISTLPRFLKDFQISPSSNFPFHFFG